MRVLVWSCPWGSQGQPLFFLNCLKKHLVLQANALQSIGIKTFMALADYQRDAIKELSTDVSTIILSARNLNAIIGTGDPLERLHADWHGPLTHALAEHMRPLLPEKIDVVITWENPLPYLEYIYPEAIIVNQMPGAFSRPPYPSTVTLDLKGLYNRSLLAEILPEQLKSSLSPLDLNTAREFSQLARHAINTLQPFSREQIFDRDAEAYLLPLQVGAHYAFRSDSGMGSSSEMLICVLDQAPESSAVAVTQYRSSFTADAPINEQNFAALKARWPHLVWSPNFEKIPSPSHFVLPLVDKLITHSSSMLFQAMVWDKPVQVLRGSYFEKFSAHNDQELARNRDVLAFLLGRYNVLGEFITKDAIFLSRLLEAALGLRGKNNINVNDLPSFHDIHPNYGKKLLAAFDGSPIIKPLSRINPSIIERDEIERKYQVRLARKGVEIASFDIFDTLITRPIETPAALFHMVQTKSESTLGMQLPDFQRIRSWAQGAAHDTSKAEEIQIEDIYRHVAEYYSLGTDHMEKLIRCEIEVETDITLPRALGKRLWSLAVASGKKIILISDMYLPKAAIEGMLEKCGYLGYHELFVSSDFGSTKKAGGLYDDVLEYLGVNGSAILHVGDNKSSDCKNAESRGFRALHIIKALDKMRKHEIYSQIFPPRHITERARSIVSGLIVNRFFEESPMQSESISLFGGEPWRLGYAALGPLYAGFAQWLHREAKRDGITKLYFLAREGYLLREIYTCLMGQEALPHAYLLCSRRASRVAALQTHQQVAAIAGAPFDQDSKFGNLIKSRFGFDVSTLSCEKLADLQFDIDEILETTSEGRAKFIRACVSIAPEILERAADERRAYLQYLDSMGFQDEERPAVVDLGWKGNMQSALVSLRNGTVCWGYYLATLAGVEDDSALNGYMRGYMGERVSATSIDILLANRRILESLTCHGDLSFSHFSIEPSGDLRPEFVENAFHASHSGIVREIHRGAKLFAEDFQRSYGKEYQEILLDHGLTSRVLRYFLEKPTKEDALLIAPLSFDDEFGGLAATTVARGVQNRTWSAGAAALYPKRPSSKAQPQPDKILVAPGGKVPLEARNIESLSDTVDGSPAPWIIRLENRVVRRFSNDRKYAKYLRNPDQYFADSKSFSDKVWLSLRKAMVKQ